MYVLTGRPLNKVSVGVRRQSVPGMQLCGEHYGIVVVGLPTGPKRAAAIHLALSYSEGDDRGRRERNFASKGEKDAPRR